MNRKELSDIISKVLLPYGFKRKGNYWVINGQELNKIVDLQKSEYSNRFYINYGFIINSIPLDGWKKHIFGGLGSKVKKEQKRINELLNFENDISDRDRAIELSKYLNEKLLSKMQSINTEEDILNDLKNREHLHGVPLKVKEHFNIDSGLIPGSDSSMVNSNCKGILNKFFGR